MENLALLLLDLLLALGLLGLAWSALNSRDPHRAVVFFIGFGLLLALVWVRLRAPDIALAEAAIGAGLTGALLLSSLRDAATKIEDTSHEDVRRDSSREHDWLLSLLTTGFVLIVGVAFVQALGQPKEMRTAEQIFAHLDSSGVSNPVTAVLLNYRAYDTLLELAVLLAALLGVLSLGPARAGYRPAGAVLTSLTRWLLPLLALTSGYILWAGAHSPGGAFQAGALLATAGVLLRLSGCRDAGLPSGTALRSLSIAGIGLFVLIGTGSMLLNGSFLTYPVSWASGLILAIEAAATLSIAATLTLAFIGGEPQFWLQRRQPPLTKNSVPDPIPRHARIADDR